MSEIVAGDGWVVDGNYSAVRDLVWDRADTVVWLDLPRLVVVRRITTRSIRRVVRREELWNGNRERWRNLVTRISTSPPSGTRGSTTRRTTIGMRQPHRTRPTRRCSSFSCGRRARSRRSSPSRACATRDTEERTALETIQYEASLVWEEDRPFVLANPDMIVVEPGWIAAGRGIRRGLAALRVALGEPEET